MEAEQKSQKIQKDEEGGDEVEDDGGLPLPLFGNG
jgi:hypothetical protein